jgi:hypothetical protein
VQAVIPVLHVQEVSVLNIKALVPVILDNLSLNYNQWKTLFLNTFGMYKLTDHVIDDVSVDSHWRRMDCTMRSWLYGTIVLDLIEVATTAAPTTRSF